MKKLIVFLASLMLWSCGSYHIQSDQAVIRTHKKTEEARVLGPDELGHVNGHRLIPIWPNVYVAMQCTGWDGAANAPTTNQGSSNSTGIMIGSTSQSAPPPLPPASQMIGRSYGGGGGAMKMYTIRGELFHNMEALGMGCVSKKDAKQKAIIAFVKAQ